MKRFDYGNTNVFHFFWMPFRGICFDRNSERIAEDKKESGKDFITL
jgi:hypothetical protein